MSDGAQPDRPDADGEEAIETREEEVLRCRDCGSEIADPADVFSPDGGPPVRMFANPHGFLWEVLTVRHARGLVAHGRPTREFSWFAGTAWTMVSCAACGLHLGWRYEAVQADPGTFFGLVRPHLIG